MLDPQRVKLDAAHIGFLKRTGQEVDFDKVKLFLQTDDSRCAAVRAEKNTPVNELHVMGGQRFGFEGNMNLQEYSRQARQINGYPLRSFSATSPAIILPPKYGGAPQYTPNPGEPENYVSRFTEPMSAMLQQNTLLLGREGYTVSNNSASDPFIPLGFEINMFKSKDAVDANEYQHQLKKYLERVENRRVIGAGGKAPRKGKAGPFGGYGGNAGMTGMGGIGGDKLAVDDGVFIGSDGKIMTQVASVTNGAYLTMNSFSNHESRVNAIQQFSSPPASNDAISLNLPSNQGNGLERAVNQDVLEDNANLMALVPASNQELVINNAFRGSAGSSFAGSQAGNLIEFDTMSMMSSRSGSQSGSIAAHNRLIAAAASASDPLRTPLRTPGRSNARLAITNGDAMARVIGSPLGSVARITPIRNRYDVSLSPGNLRSLFLTPQTPHRTRSGRQYQP